jgi:tRNA-specific 2-thiouridylase
LTQAIETAGAKSFLYVLYLASSMKKVLVAMSGGVDSSVSAALLKDKGCEVAGATMCLGFSAGTGQKKCCGPKEIDDALRVCTALGMRHYVFDFSEDMEALVIGNFLSEYSRGRTPNPCIECNRHLKFRVLLKKARALGFDYLATGHYAGITEQGGSCYLQRPKDRRKDQTYFLYCIAPGDLQQCLFPLADYTKDEVRLLARQHRLPVAEKPESQDICFIPEKGLHAFLEARLPEAIPGDIVDAGGTVLGRHKGICFYTIGQRQGLGISAHYPLYVTALDADRQRVIVGYKNCLKAAGLVAGGINMLSDDVPQQAHAKIRYGHKAQPCSFTVSGDELTVVFNEPQEAVTPGQSVVLYDGDRVLGGGIIEKVLTCEKN